MTGTGAAATPPVSVSALAAVAMGCAAVPASRAVDPPKPVRIALFTPSNDPGIEGEGIGIERVLGRALAESGAFMVSDPARVREAVRAQNQESCADDLPCVRAVGAALGVDKILLARLASLGDTVLVRVSLVDVREGTQERTLQEVVRRSTTEKLEGTLTSLGRNLALGVRAPASREDDWYESWWIWVAATGAALVGGGALALLASRGSGPDPDAVIIPP